jgi:hypothetical protein
MRKFVCLFVCLFVVLAACMSGSVVYVSRTGKKYHSRPCSGANISIDISAVGNRTRCAKCW